jgi:tRNA U34 5-methylaminomethyl-2-thiouridine-forming methyltransferase MnmC
LRVAFPKRATSFLGGNGLPDGASTTASTSPSWASAPASTFSPPLLAHQGPQHLHYTSFEAFPLPAADIERALQAFPELAPIAARFPQPMGHRG